MTLDPTEPLSSGRLRPVSPADSQDPDTLALALALSSSPSEQTQEREDTLHPSNGSTEQARPAVVRSGDRGGS